MALSSRRASWVLALVPDLGPTSRPLQSSVSETPCAVTGCGRDERREGNRAPVSSPSPCLCLSAFTVLGSSPSQEVHIVNAGSHRMRTTLLKWSIQAR